MYAQAEKGLGAMNAGAIGGQQLAAEPANGSVAAEFGRLIDARENVVANFERLRDILAPILVAETMNENPKPPTHPEPLRCELATRIRDQSDALFSLSRALETIRLRVHLG